MAMNFATLVDEFKQRGFDYLADTRANRYVNQSYKSICNRAPWPFLLTTTTGTAPLTISDLRAVLSVIDTTTGLKLHHMDRRHLTEISTDLTTTGNPTYWYQESRTVLSVYPANTTDTLSVHYLKVPTTLTGTDAHIIPDEFEDLIIDGAAIKAYKDNDELDSAASLAQFYNEGLREMIDVLISRNHASPNYIVQTNTYEMGGY
jgi:hypothetical protein